VNVWKKEEQTTETKGTLNTTGYIDVVYIIIIQSGDAFNERHAWGGGMIQ